MMRRVAAIYSVIFFILFTVNMASAENDRATQNPTNTQRPSSNFFKQWIPNLISPEDNAQMDNGCPEGATPADPIIWDFSWSSVPHAVKYQISILQDGKALVTRTVKAPKFTYTCFGDSDAIPLCEIDYTRGGWSWRVRAGFRNMWGRWSEEKHFEIEDIDYNCAAADAYGLSNSQSDPSSPAELSAGTKVAIKFSYYTPYREGAYISITPFFQGEPLPETSYESTVDELYPAGYGGKEGEGYIIVKEAGVSMDSIKIDMYYIDHSLCDSTMLSVDYSF